MFKYNVGQHVWFLVGPMSIGPLSDDEDPEYLEGFITKRYTGDEWYTSPNAVSYEIQSGEDVYDREEGDIYPSFDELNKAVTEDLQYWVDHTEQRIKEVEEKLTELRTDGCEAKQRLARWVERSKKGSGK